MGQRPFHGSFCLGQRWRRGSTAEWLEPRLALHAVGGHSPDESEWADLLGASPAFDEPVAAFALPLPGAGGGGGSKFPLTAIPVLNSNLRARVQLYLDFDGHVESVWGRYRSASTTPYDQDNDVTTFSAGELNSIRRIFDHVAEDFAPFEINVTTVKPASFANGAALRVAIGGEGLWAGGRYGGIAYVDSFTNPIANTAFVFSKNLANGNVRYVSETISHESGHSFGLLHQSTWRGATKVNEYSPGPGDGRAPIMGNSDQATRGLWWLGTPSSSPNYLQDDMAIIARPANGFGYRVDDHGDTIGAATPLAIASRTASGAGIITRTTDVDAFSFKTGAGMIVMSVLVPQGINNLDAKAELRTAGGALVAAADPAGQFGLTLTVNLAAGDYRLLVASHGGYGDVGQYSISGSIVPTSGGSTRLSESSFGFGGFSSDVSGSWQSGFLMLDEAPPTIDPATIGLAATASGAQAVRASMPDSPRVGRPSDRLDAPYALPPRTSAPRTEVAYVGAETPRSKSGRLTSNSRSRDDQRRADWRTAVEAAFLDWAA